MSQHLTVAGELSEAIADVLIDIRCSILEELVVPAGVTELAADRICAPSLGLFSGAKVVVDDFMEQGTFKIVASCPGDALEPEVVESD